METAPRPSQAEAVSTRRQALDRAATGGALAVAHFVAHHWLALANLFFAAVVLAAALAPLLLAAGLEAPARAIYVALKITCHQMPERSYFLFGEQMAFCQRNTAIFGAAFLAGLAFVPLRRRLRPLSWKLFFLFALPMAVDGFTQLFGWRESTWELRTVTGTLFAVGWVWFIYPWAEAHLLRMDAQLHAEMHALNREP
ncbi:MAG: DUF2085 domain-containing protein [Chloroflexi bacterium]|nr:DUF2085 domain-containing protein [Chloroflexota bacterium]